MNKYTVKDFAKVVGVSENTLHRWRRAGTLVPHRTLGGKPYYTDEHAMVVKNSK